MAIGMDSELEEQQYQQLLEVADNYQQLIGELTIAWPHATMIERVQWIKTVEEAWRKLWTLLAGS
jgi:hypothetical protein